MKAFWVFIVSVLLLSIIVLGVVKTKPSTVSTVVIYIAPDLSTIVDDQKHLSSTNSTFWKYIGNDNLHAIMRDCAQRLYTSNVGKLIVWFAGHSNSFYIRNRESYVSLRSFCNLLEMLHRKIDVLVCDSCAMGSLELVYEVRNCVDIVVACEGYAGDSGFLSCTTLLNLRNDLTNVEIGTLLVKNATESNDRWNASVLSTESAEALTHKLQHLTPTELVPVYPNFQPIDIQSSFALAETPDCVKYFRQNNIDSKTNHGISITLGVALQLRSLYQDCSLYRDFPFIQQWHHQYDYDLRILSINLQDCYTSEAVDKWWNEWLDAEADVVCCQELWTFPNLSGAFIQTYDKKTGCAVIWTDREMYDKFHSILSIYSVHLNDIPSPLHYLHNLPYEGNPEPGLSMNELLRECWRQRVPALIDIMSKDTLKHITILAGDFNEPLSQPYPVYTWLTHQEFVNQPTSITWPSPPYYVDHPKQQIDGIFVRDSKQSVRILHQATYRSNKWESDHFGVICDIRIII